MAKKGTYPSTLEDREGFSSQLAELIRRFGADQLDIPRATPLLQAIMTDQYDNVQFVDSFVRYQPMLLSLEAQLTLLREYNEKYWDGVITEDMFAAVDTTSDHVQRVENLEILYVQFGTDKETFENWVAVIKGEQPNFWRGDSLAKGYDIRRLAVNTRQYTLGIFRVHINLAAHWESKNGRSVDNVREQVKGTPEQLAHGEVFAAYALHTELLQATDGTNLPYFDSAGYEVMASGDGKWRNAPCGDWDAGYRRARVDSRWTDDRRQDFAAPVVWES